MTTINVLTSVWAVYLLNSIAIGDWRFSHNDFPSQITTDVPISFVSYSVCTLHSADGVRLHSFFFCFFFLFSDSIFTQHLQHKRHILIARIKERKNDNNLTSISMKKIGISPFIVWHIRYILPMCCIQNTHSEYRSWVHNHIAAQQISMYAIDGETVYARLR